MVREVLPHLGLSNIEGLQALLEDNAVWLQQQAVRSRLREVFFAPYFGCSSEIVAAVLKSVRHILRLAHRSS